MKLNEILNEMAWPDKFRQIEQKMRSSNMTLDDFVGFMEKEYNVLVKLESSMNAEPLTIGSAGITPKPLSAAELKAAGMSDSHIKQLAGKRMLTMQVGPGADPSTPINELGNFYRVLRHEMAHYMQGEDFSDEKHARYQQTYASPHDDPIHPKAAQYTLQAVERSPQAMDLATYLAQLQIKPEQFDKAIGNLLRKLQQGEITNSNDLLDKSMKQLERYGGLGGDMAGIKAGRGYGTAIGMLQALIAQMAMARFIASKTTDKQTRQMIRRQYHQLLKLTTKRYPKVKAYLNQTRAEDEAAFEKNNPTRAQINAVKQGLADIAELIGL
jgi:hypothetical protein